MREFKVILEKDGKRVMVGEMLNCEGTYHTPRQIFDLIEKGWKVIAILSCFRWYWSGRRYISPYEEKKYWEVQQDVYGRLQATVLYSGYYDIVDVFYEDGSRKTYRQKLWHCHEADEEKVIFADIPDEVNKLFEETRWFNESK